MSRRPFGRAGFDVDEDTLDEDVPDESETAGREGAATEPISLENPEDRAPRLRSSWASIIS